MHENYMREVYVLGKEEINILRRNPEAFATKALWRKFKLNNHISYDNTETDLKCLLRSSSRRNIE